MTTPERLLHEFNTGHLGAAHGIAKVLSYVADNYGDPESWGAVPHKTLVKLAGELTGDLPAPYGRTPSASS
jgi:hypothetical protein